MRSASALSARWVAPWITSLGLMASWAGPALADVESGPAVDGKTPALTVLVVTGEYRDKELDIAAALCERPTLFVLIPVNRWTRPSARLLRELDKLLADIGGEPQIVAVWLTDDQAASKTYLPLAQQSLQFQRTALAVYVGEKSGPQDWMISSRADMTIVVAAKGKVAARFGLVSPNDTVAPEVVKALKAALESR